MVKAPLNVDLVRLKHFLKSLEADAQITVGDVDLNAQEVEILKREIADIEGVLNGSPDHGTRAVLFQIDIDLWRGSPPGQRARSRQRSGGRESRLTPLFKPQADFFEGDARRFCGPGFSRAHSHRKRKRPR